MPNGFYLRTTQIKQRIAPLLKTFWSTRPNYAGFSDDVFYIPTYNEIIYFLENHHIRPSSIVSEAFDCDDYAFVLKGSVSLYVRDNTKLEASMCIGIAWANFTWKTEREFHACNWVFSSDNIFYWIEPQDGKLYPFNSCIGNLRLLLV